MPQQESCNRVEPLILEDVQWNGSTIMLIDAHYDYVAKCFRGYAVVDKKPKLISLNLEPHVAVRHLSKWVHGWITDNQITRLFGLAKDVVKEHIIVEVGSWKGKSTIALGWGSKAGNMAKVWAIDPHAATPQYWLWMNKGVVASTFDQFKANIHAAGVDDIVYPLVEPSVAASSMLSGPVGLLFVDGNHDYCGQDISHWWNRVVSGGWILLHDSHAAGVIAAIAALEDTDEFVAHKPIDGMAQYQRKDS